MEYILVPLCSFIASLMAFYSGFGLGTILMPILAIFFPLPVAIGMTAIVHLFHNLIKTTILWESIQWKTVILFGIPSLIGASVGAWVLQKMAFLPPIASYSFTFIEGEFSILHLAIGVLLILVATLEVSYPKIFRLNALFGGIVSGFFGGFSGNQGAFRSLFLIESQLNAKGFIGTNAVIATVVDVTRLIIYSFSFRALFLKIPYPLLSFALGGALIGILFGGIFLKKITFPFIRKLIIGLLYLLGFLLAIGII